MAVRVEGVKKLRAHISDLIAGMDLDPKSVGRKTAVVRRAHAMITETLTEAANVIKTEGQSRARTQGWPGRTIGTFFTFADPEGMRPKKTTALTGIRTGAPTMRGKKDTRIYKEWKAASTKSPRAKQPVGALIGESLASMYEHGTTRMQAKPAFRPAVAAARGRVKAALIAGYKRVIDSFDWPASDMPKAA